MSDAPKLLSAEELERTLSFLEHHERTGFPHRLDYSRAADAILAHITALEAERDGARSTLRDVKKLRGILKHFQDNHDERSPGLAFPSKEDLLFEKAYREGYAAAVAQMTNRINEVFDLGALREKP